MGTAGYYRFPTVHTDTTIFICEDDLWTVPTSGGVARRLTAGLGECQRPALSPDGTRVAFTGREEGGPEVYVMPARGGVARRVTHQGAKTCQGVGWQDEKIVFATNASQPFGKLQSLWAVSPTEGLPRNLGFGSAMSLNVSARGQRAIGRNTLDIARWKRYRGGTAGNIWMEVGTTGRFEPFLPMAAETPIRSNLCNPMFIGERLYFVSDHEGVGNLYSSLSRGEDLQRHTDHGEYYVRNPSTDGGQIVYHAGGRLYRLELASGDINEVPIELLSPRTQRARKFVKPGRYLEGYDVHPDGHSIAVTARGRAVTMPNWEQSVTPVGGQILGEADARHRLTTWLADGEHLVTVSDARGEEALELHRHGQSEPIRVVGDVDLGRILALVPSPAGNQVVLSNHRQELWWVDLGDGRARRLDHSPFDRIGGMAISPNGRYVAYGYFNSATTSILRIYDRETTTIHDATRTVLRDVCPSFDPEGGYLYFLSCRVFNPVYDNLDFDMNFPKGMKPYCLILKKERPSPFIPEPLSSAEIRKQRARELVGEEDEKELDPHQLEIDFEGLADRLVVFPAPEAVYEQIGAAKGKVFFTTRAVHPSIQPLEERPPTATLHCYDFEHHRLQRVASRLESFRVAMTGEMIAYQTRGGRLRILNVSENFTAHWDEYPRSRKASRKTGWLELNRIKISVNATQEWRQMYREAWRLQRDQFWTSDMAGLDWMKVYHRYLPLLETVSTRSEFSDLMWEMQGELGTSHCYEMGGDYRKEPQYGQGMLGVDLTYDAEHEAYRITRLVAGDSWVEGWDSPLRAPGINAKEGDLILAVAGQKVSASTSPGMLLVNQAAHPVSLTLADPEGHHPRTVHVKPLTDEVPPRYRQWVEANRAVVHTATKGRVGYVHIPNMMGWGMAEFFRGYLAEVHRDALIVDVRFNGGGHTSQLILEKLARKRLGYDLSRWGKPEPYPVGSVLGPIVAITNEFAGSDGDIFSHSFKMMKLGTLLGKRTWGGVIGIHPRHPLVDGTMTSQPEFSFWFKDCGWKVENYGTDPDVEVHYRPEDYMAGRDPQLERAIEEIETQMKASPPALPNFPPRPSRALPTLPPRKD